MNRNQIIQLKKLILSKINDNFIGSVKGIMAEFFYKDNGMSDEDLFDEINYLVEEQKELINERNQLYKRIDELEDYIIEMNDKLNLTKFILNRCVIKKEFDEVDGSNYMALYNLKLKGDISVQASIYDELMEDK